MKMLTRTPNHIASPVHGPQPPVPHLTHLEFSSVKFLDFSAQPFAQPQLTNNTRPNTRIARCVKTSSSWRKPPACAPTFAKLIKWSASPSRCSSSPSTPRSEEHTSELQS